MPQRIVDELPSGRDAIPEFAASRQRVAYVVIENIDGRPARILDARGEHWTFDDEGRVSDDMHQRMIARLDLMSTASTAKRGPVVDLVPELKKRELQARQEWTVTADDLDRIAADLWPGIHGPAPDATTVKGKAPKKPPLSHEGRWALERIEKHVASVRHRLGGLSERALKGLAFEANRHRPMGRGDALARHAKRLEAILAAYQTSRGEWYAVLEVARAHADKPYLWVGGRDRLSRQVCQPLGCGRGQSTDDGRQGRLDECQHGNQRQHSLCAGMAAGGVGVAVVEHAAIWREANI